jgi:hypothetical protein
MAPQRLEKIESAPENGMVSEASNPQDLVQGRAAVRAGLGLASRKGEELQKKGKRGKTPGERGFSVGLLVRRIEISGRGIPESAIV